MVKRANQEDEELPNKRKFSRREWLTLFGGNPIPVASGGVVTLESYITSLSPGFWLQADYDQNSAYVDGNAIGTGYDASVNQLDVTQAVAGVKPTYKTNILNGLPVFRFDGADYLRRINVTRSLLAATNQASILMVLKQTGTQAQNAPFAWRDEADSDPALDGLVTYNNLIYFDFANQGTGRVSVAQPGGWDDAWHLVELYHNAAGTSEIIVDGTQILNPTGAAAAFSADPQHPLQIGNFGATYFLGDIYMILVFPASLTAIQRTTLRDLISDKTGLSFSLSLSSPSNYQVFQRSGATGTISISGSIERVSGAVTIEASFNGGAYADIATGVTSNFSGTLAGQAQGQGTLTVRIKGTTIAAAADYVGIGDIFIVAGQSNAMGRGTNNQTYSHATLKAAKYTPAGAWAELTDPMHVGVGGSVWPLIATSYLASQGVPCAFVPCGVDGSRIATWQSGQANYNAMKARALVTGAKTVLFWGGEGDVVDGTTDATYNAALDSFANAVNADLGVKLMPCKLQDCTGLDETSVNNAIGTAWADNANILTGPDLHGLATDDTYHLKTNAKLSSAAGLWWTAIQTAFGW